jgi:hypothetical protein
VAYHYAAAEDRECSIVDGIVAYFCFPFCACIARYGHPPCHWSAFIKKLFLFIFFLISKLSFILFRQLLCLLFAQSRV